MNGDEGRSDAVTATLPSGKSLRVQVAGAGDGMGSVGLLDRVDLDDAMDSVGELGRLLFEKLQAIKPTKAAVELTLGFTVQAGKLTALIVSGKADASLTLMMEWAERA
jgi:hypothetical protein